MNTRVIVWSFVVIAICASVYYLLVTGKGNSGSKKAFARSLVVSPCEMLVTCEDVPEVVVVSGQSSQNIEAVTWPGRLVQVKTVALSPLDERIAAGYANMYASSIASDLLYGGSFAVVRSYLAERVAVSGIMPRSDVLRKLSISLKLIVFEELRNHGDDLCKGGIDCRIEWDMLLRVKELSRYQTAINSKFRIRTLSVADIEVASVSDVIEFRDLFVPYPPAIESPAAANHYYHNALRQEEPRD